MNIESVREYCLKKKGVTESFPFDDTTLVIKVIGKMFILINLDTEPSINLKCDPEKAIELREEFPTVRPGYHMNKKHWNTVFLDGKISPDKIKAWIDHSYSLVVNKLTKIQRQELK